MPSNSFISRKVVKSEQPKRLRNGSSVRFTQDTTAHQKTGFGFDTLHVAKNRYASDQYHDFIRFKVRYLCCN